MEHQAPSPHTLPEDPSWPSTQPTMEVGYSLLISPWAISHAVHFSFLLVWVSLLVSCLPQAKEGYWEERHMVCSVGGIWAA